MTNCVISVWSFPVTLCPTKKTTPFSGTDLIVRRRLIMDSMAEVTFFFVPFDLMLEDCDSSFLR
jgi:hypothetical protein